MKIVYLTDEYPPEYAGGSGVVAQHLARGMSSAGHDVSVIVPTARTCVWEEKQGGITVLGLPRTETPHPFRTGLENPAQTKAIGEILARLRPDVVHAHNLHWQLSYASLETARCFTDRLFLTAHDLMLVACGKVFPPDKACISGPEAGKICRANFLRDLRLAKWQYVPGRNARIRRYLRNVRRIFAVSNFVKTALEANGIKNSQVIFNGIDPTGFAVLPEAVESFKKKHGIDSRATVFFGGRSGEAKGIGVLLRAFAKLTSRHQDVRLLMAAKPQEIAQTFSIARGLKVESYIRFLGWLEPRELPVVYAASTLAVTPSIYFDPFQMVNIEAMAAHKPVVGTCFGGTPEVVEDGVTGYIVNPHDTSGFAEKISRLLRDRDLAYTMGEKGYKRLQRYFSLDLQVQKTLEAYRG